MTREEAKHLSDILEAYSEGKIIEYRKKNTLICAWEVYKGQSIDENYYEYRIKPELKYRPFKNQEECCQEMLKHQPFGWIRSTMSGNWYVIESISDDIYYDGTFISYDVAFECCEFIDGTPFGVKI